MQAITKLVVATTGVIDEDDIPSDVRAAFLIHDRNGSGYIEKRELQDALKPLKVAFDHIIEFKAILQRYDADGNGRIDLDEFAHIVHDLRVEEATTPRTKNAFHSVDDDGGGYLDKKELNRALEPLGLELPAGAKALHILRKYDESGDGQLDLEEFSMLVQDLRLEKTTLTDAHYSDGWRVVGKTCRGQQIFQNIKSKKGPCFELPRPRAAQVLSNLMAGAAELANAPAEEKFDPLLDEEELEIRKQKRLQKLALQKAAEMRAWAEASRRKAHKAMKLRQKAIDAAAAAFRLAIGRFQRDEDEEALLKAVFVARPAKVPAYLLQVADGALADVRAARHEPDGSAEGEGEGAPGGNGSDVYWTTLRPSEGDDVKQYVAALDEKLKEKGWRTQNADLLQQQQQQQQQQQLHGGGSSVGGGGGGGGGRKSRRRAARRMRSRIDSARLIVVIVTREYAERLTIGALTDPIVKEYLYGLQRLAPHAMLVPLLVESFESADGFVFPIDRQAWQGPIAQLQDQLCVSALKSRSSEQGSGGSGNGSAVVPSPLPSRRPVGETAIDLDEILRIKLKRDSPFTSPPESADLPSSAEAVVTMTFHEGTRAGEIDLPELKAALVSRLSSELRAPKVLAIQRRYALITTPSDITLLAHVDENHFLHFSLPVKPPPQLSLYERDPIAFANQPYIPPSSPPAASSASLLSPSNASAAASEAAGGGGAGDALLSPSFASSAVPATKTRRAKQHGGGGGGDPMMAALEAAVTRCWNPSSSSSSSSSSPSWLRIDDLEDAHAPSQGPGASTAAPSRSSPPAKTAAKATATTTAATTATSAAVATSHPTTIRMRMPRQCALLLGQLAEQRDGALKALKVRSVRTLPPIVQRPVRLKPLEETLHEFKLKGASKVVAADAKWARMKAVDVGLLRAPEDSLSGALASLRSPSAAERGVVLRSISEGALSPSILTRAVTPGALSPAGAGRGVPSPLLGDGRPVVVTPGSSSMLPSRKGGRPRERWPLSAAAAPAEEEHDGAADTLDAIASEDVAGLAMEHDATASQAPPPPKQVQVVSPVMKGRRGLQKPRPPARLHPLAGSPYNRVGGAQGASSPGAYWPSSPGSAGGGAARASLFFLPPPK